MTTSPPVDHPRLRTALEAAERAAGLQADRFGEHGDVEYKGPRDLVTAVDLEAERLIVETIEEAHPDDAILGEEGGQRGESDTRWIVDPVDGTTNYAHGIPTYAVSIGVEVEGRREVGVVHHTPAEDTYAAVRGEGAYLNGAALSTSDVDALEESVVATGVSAASGADDPPFRVFGRLTERTHGFRRFGSAATDLALLAAGRFDGAYHHGTSDWDVVAGALLVEEAGGRTTDRRDDLGAFLATNGRIHDELVALVE